MCLFVLFALLCFCSCLLGVLWLVDVGLRVSGTGLIVSLVVGVVLHTSTGFCGCCLRC